MNAPPQRLNVADLNEWIETERQRLFEFREGAWWCRACGAQPLNQRCAISLHAIELPICSGPGRVKWITLPCCPKCESDTPQHLSTCVHLPLIDIALFRQYPAPDSNSHRGAGRCRGKG